MKCDMDCLHCALPAEKCRGGTIRTANPGNRTASRMNDGVKSGTGKVYRISGCRKGRGKAGILP